MSRPIRDVDALPRLVVRVTWEEFGRLVAGDAVVWYERELTARTVLGAEVYGLVRAFLEGGPGGLVELAPQRHAPLDRVAP